MINVRVSTQEKSRNTPQFHFVLPDLYKNKYNCDINLLGYMKTPFKTRTFLLLLIAGKQWKLSLPRLYCAAHLYSIFTSLPIPAQHFCLHVTLLEFLSWHSSQGIRLITQQYHYQKMFLSNKSNNNRKWFCCYKFLIIYI